MKKTSKKSFSIIMSLLLVLALVAPIIAPASTAMAANKKHTIGAFTINIPSSWSDDGADGINYSKGFFTDKGIFALQSVPAGKDKPTKAELKKFIKDKIKEYYGKNHTKLKFGTKKTGVGKAVMATCKVHDGVNKDISVEYKMFVVVKDENMCICTGTGTSEKVEDTFLKSLKLKK